MLAPGSVSAGAIAAVVLLVCFCAAIAIAMLRGEEPQCHCFGQLHSAPAGAGALVRNALLAGLAAAVLALASSDPGPSAVAWVGALSGAELAALAGAVTLLAVLLGVTAFAIELLRRHGVVVARLEALEQHTGVKADSLPEREAGLPIGARAPAFEAPRAADRARVALDALLEPGHPLALVFTDPGCGPCNVLLPELAELERRLGGELTLCVLARGSREHARAKAQEHGLANVLADEAGEIAGGFEVAATPAAVVIGADGRIASRLALGSEAVTAALYAAAGRRSHELRPGEALPDVELHELDGSPVQLSAALAGGRPTTLVFWNPRCGFCRDMHQELRDRTSSAPVLLVSTGSAQEIGALGFAFPMLQDRAGSAVARLGAQGTPSALLVGADGTLAAPPAVGREAVLALVAPAAERQKTVAAERHGGRGMSEQASLAASKGKAKLKLHRKVARSQSHAVTTQLKAALDTTTAGPHDISSTAKPLLQTIKSVRSQVKREGAGKHTKLVVAGLADLEAGLLKLIAANKSSDPNKTLEIAAEGMKSLSAASSKAHRAGHDWPL